MFNFIGSIHTLIVILLAFLVMGLTGGFLASVGVVVAIAGGCLLYKRYATRKPLQRLQIESFGGYLYRVEVA